MLPYAPRLAGAGVSLSRVLVVETERAQDRLWSAEQLLRAAAGAVLLWIDQADTQSLRRLQLAAEENDSCVLVYRPVRHANEATPSALRLRVWREQGMPQVQVLKCRGMTPRPMNLGNDAEDDDEAFVATTPQRRAA